MADRVQKVNYCKMTVSNRAGHGANVLGELADANVDLLACSGFPAGSGKAQIDLVAANMAAVRRVAKKHGWRVSPTKKAFLVQGDDRLGAVHRHLDKLAGEKISVTAAYAMGAGKGRYALLMWVRPKDYARAARTLRAR